MNLNYSNSMMVIDDLWKDEKEDPRVMALHFFKLVRQARLDNKKFIYRVHIEKTFREIAIIEFFKDERQKQDSMNGATFKDVPTFENCSDLYDYLKVLNTNAKE